MYNCIKIIINIKHTPEFVWAAVNAIELLIVNVENAIVARNIVEIEHFQVRIRP